MKLALPTFSLRCVVPCRQLLHGHGTALNTLSSLLDPSFCFCRPCAPLAAACTPAPHCARAPHATGTPPDRQLLGTGPWRPPTETGSWILGGRGRFMSCWRLPRRPSPIFVRPAAARARRGLPPLPPPAAALARRAAPRPHGRLQVGRSWRFLSDLERSKEPSQLAPSKPRHCRRGFLFGFEPERERVPFESGG